MARDWTPLETVHEGARLRVKRTEGRAELLRSLVVERDDLVLGLRALAVSVYGEDSGLSLEVLATRRGLGEGGLIGVGAMEWRGLDCFDVTLRARGTMAVMWVSRGP